MPRLRAILALLVLTTFSIGLSTAAQPILQADVIAHECEHAAEQLRRTLKLDDDEHDEETNAEITGLLNHLVMEELAKI